MYFNSEQVAIYMNVEFGIDVDEDYIGEETVYLKKDEVDDVLLEPNLLKLIDNEVRLDMCNFKIGKEEWLIAVAHNVISSEPLFLVCLKDNEILRARVYD